MSSNRSHQDIIIHNSGWTAWVTSLSLAIGQAFNKTSFLVYNFMTTTY
jgi:hypothetical protein